MLYTRGALLKGRQELRVVLAHLRAISLETVHAVAAWKVKFRLLGDTSDLSLSTTWNPQINKEGKRSSVS